ncbi:MAG TPA: hypothetical protein DCZ30_05440 [Clostridiales bacterium]|nr:hypothetical protein [Clostridiales bacterium]
MNGFFEWFKSSTKMKRWIFLILVGVVSLVFSISNILVIKELDFNTVGKIVISFIIGFIPQNSS